FNGKFAIADRRRESKGLTSMVTMGRRGGGRIPWGLPCPARADERIQPAALELVPHRRQVTQPGGHFRKCFDHVIDLFPRVVFAERENDASLRQRMVESNGCQHRRYLQ